MQPKLRHLLRIVAWILIVTFGVEEVCRAAPLSQAQPRIISQPLAVDSLSDIIQDPTRISLPLEYVSLKEVHQGTNGKLIIHIQDAHANLSAQENLAKTLDHLMRRYELPLVLVEGSEGDATLEELKAIAPQKTWQKAAKRFLYDGIISGEEYLNLTSDMDMKLWGIENKALYHANLEAYADLVKTRFENLEYLHRISKSLTRVKNRLYPKTLLAYEEIEHTAEVNGSLMKQLEMLSRLAKRQAIPAADLESLIQLMQLKLFEKKLDFERVQYEEVNLFKLMSQRGSQEVVKNFKQQLERSAQSQITQHVLFKEIFEHATEVNINLRQFPFLQAYAKYLALFAEINLEQFLDDIRTLETRVFDAYLETDDLKKLRALDLYITLLTSAHRIQLSSDQHQILVSNIKDFPTQGWQAFLNRLLAEQGYFQDFVPHEKLLDDTAEALFEFYTLVEERDYAFLENAMHQMNVTEQQVAFLIAGGYHTEHLTQLMRQAGTSYIVLAPHVSYETDIKQYEELLLAPVTLARSKASINVLNAVRKAGLRFALPAVRQTYPDNDYPVLDSNQDAAMLSWLTSLDPSGGRSQKWTEDTVIATIQKAKKSKRPILSLAPGAIQSKTQRSTQLGKELYHAFAAVVVSKSIPTLRDWPEALRQAGYDPEAEYAPKWTRDTVIATIQKAKKSKRPILSLAPGAIRSETQRSTMLGKELYHAYAVVVINKSIPTLKDWSEALIKAGYDPEEEYAPNKWTRDTVIATIQKAKNSKTPKLSLAPGAIRSETQRNTRLGKELFHAYAAVVVSKSIPTLKDWPEALKEAGEDPQAIYERRPSGARNQKWTRDTVIATIQKAKKSKSPILSLAPGAVISNEQRSTKLGKELYHAFAAVVINKSIPTLQDWPEALRQAGYDPEEEYAPNKYKWTEENVIATIQKAKKSETPKLSLAPGAIRSETQRNTRLGKELFHAYAAVVVSKSIPTLKDWPEALKEAGEDPQAIYERRPSGARNQKWTRDTVIATIQKAKKSKRPILSLAPGAIQSKTQRSTQLGKELFRAYKAVVDSKSIPTLRDWPEALRQAGYDPEAEYAPKWTRDTVIATIQKAKNSKTPILSLAPGAVTSESQRSTQLGKELFHVYAAVVVRKSIPTLKDWPEALRQAGYDPEEEYAPNKWTRDTVIATIQKAKNSKRPKLSLNPAAIRSESQRNTQLGKELFRAYQTVVVSKTIPTLEDWADALKQASTSAQDEVYTPQESWDEASVIATIQKAKNSETSKLSLNPAAIRSESQRNTRLGKELFHAYAAVVTAKSISTLKNWPEALEKAGEDPQKIYKRGPSGGRSQKWTEDTVIATIQKAKNSKTPILSLAPGAINSETQRSTKFGKELYRAYRAVVDTKSIPTLKDWAEALKQAGEDPQAIYERPPSGARKQKWTRDTVIATVQKAKNSQRPKLSLAVGAVISESQRSTQLGKELFHAYAAVVINKTIPTLEDWADALKQAGTSAHEEGYAPQDTPNDSWDEASVIATIQRAKKSETPKLSLAPGTIQSETQRSTKLGKELYHAYTAVVNNKSIPTLKDWSEALIKAGYDPEEEYAPNKWTRDTVIATIQKAKNSKTPILSLAPGTIQSETQRNTRLGKELYHAYQAVVGRKSIPTLKDWPEALKQAGEDPQAIYERGPSGGRSQKWTRDTVIATIQKAKKSKRPALSLAPGAIKSKTQRSTKLGKELYHAYTAVVNNKSIPTLEDWAEALKEAGEDPQKIYERLPSGARNQESDEKYLQNLRSELSAINHRLALMHEWGSVSTDPDDSPDMLRSRKAVLEKEISEITGESFDQTDHSSGARGTNLFEPSRRWIWTARIMWTLAISGGIWSLATNPAVIVPLLTQMLPLGIGLLALTLFSSVFDRYSFKLLALVVGTLVALPFAYGFMESFGGATNIFDVLASTLRRFGSVFAAFLVGKTIFASAEDRAKPLPKRLLSALRGAAAMTAVSAIMIYSVIFPFLEHFYPLQSDTLPKVLIERGFLSPFMATPIILTATAIFSEEKDVSGERHVRNAIASLFYSGATLLERLKSFKDNLFQNPSIRNTHLFYSIDFPVWFAVFFIGSWFKVSIASFITSLGFPIKPEDSLSYLHMLVSFPYIVFMQKFVQSLYQKQKTEVAVDQEALPTSDAVTNEVSGARNGKRKTKVIKVAVPDDSQLILMIREYQDLTRAGKFKQANHIIRGILGVAQTEPKLMFESRIALGWSYIKEAQILCTLNHDRATELTKLAADEFEKALALVDDHGVDGEAELESLLSAIDELKERLVELEAKPVDMQQAILDLLSRANKGSSIEDVQSANAIYRYIADRDKLSDEVRYFANQKLVVGIGAVVAALGPYTEENREEVAALVEEARERLQRLEELFEKAGVDERVLRSARKAVKRMDGVLQTAYGSAEAEEGEIESESPQSGNAVQPADSGNETPEDKLIDDLSFDEIKARFEAAGIPIKAKTKGYPRVVLIALGDGTPDAPRFPNPQVFTEFLMGAPFFMNESTARKVCEEFRFRDMSEDPLVTMQKSMTRETALLDEKIRAQVKKDPRSKDYFEAKFLKRYTIASFMNHVLTHFFVVQAEHGDDMPSAIEIFESDPRSDRDKVFMRNEKRILEQDALPKVRTTYLVFIQLALDHPEIVAIMRRYLELLPILRRVEDFLKQKDILQRQQSELQGQMRRTNKAIMDRLDTNRRIIALDKTANTPKRRTPSRVFMDFIHMTPERAVAYFVRYFSLYLEHPEQFTAPAELFEHNREHMWQWMDRDPTNFTMGGTHPVPFFADWHMAFIEMVMNDHTLRQHLVDYQGLLITRSELGHQARELESQEEELLRLAGSRGHVKDAWRSVHGILNMVQYGILPLQEVIDGISVDMTSIDVTSEPEAFHVYEELRGYLEGLTTDFAQDEVDEDPFDEEPEPIQLNRFWKLIDEILEVLETLQPELNFEEFEMGVSERLDDLRTDANQELLTSLKGHIHDSLEEKLAGSYEPRDVVDGLDQGTDALDHEEAEWSEYEDYRDEDESDDEENPDYTGARDSNKPQRISGLRKQIEALLHQRQELRDDALIKETGPSSEDNRLGKQFWRTRKRALVSQIEDLEARIEGLRGELRKELGLRDDEPLGARAYPSSDREGVKRAWESVYLVFNEMYQGESSLPEIMTGFREEAAQVPALHSAAEIYRVLIDYLETLAEQKEEVQISNFWDFVYRSLEQLEDAPEDPSTQAEYTEILLQDMETHRNEENQRFLEIFGQHMNDSLEEIQKGTYRSDEDHVDKKLVSGPLADAAREIISKLTQPEKEDEGTSDAHGSGARGTVWIEELRPEDLDFSRFGEWTPSYAREIWQATLAQGKSAINLILETADGATLRQMSDSREIYMTLLDDFLRRPNEWHVYFHNLVRQHGAVDEYRLWEYLAREAERYAEDELIGQRLRKMFVETEDIHERWIMGFLEKIEFPGDGYEDESFFKPVLAHALQKPVAEWVDWVRELKAALLEYDTQIYEITQWDLRNRYPDRDGVVMLHGSTERFRPEQQTIEVLGGFNLTWQYASANTYTRRHDREIWIVKVPRHKVYRTSWTSGIEETDGVISVLRSRLNVPVVLHTVNDQAAAAHIPRVSQPIIELPSEADWTYVGDEDPTWVAQVQAALGSRKSHRKLNVDEIIDRIHELEQEVVKLQRRGKDFVRQPLFDLKQSDMKHRNIYGLRSIDGQIARREAEILRLKRSLPKDADLSGSRLEVKQRLEKVAGRLDGLARMLDPTFDGDHPIIQTVSQISANITRKVMREYDEAGKVHDDDIDDEIGQQLSALIYAEHGLKVVVAINLIQDRLYFEQNVRDIESLSVEDYSDLKEYVDHTVLKYDHALTMLSEAIEGPNAELVYQNGPLVNALPFQDAPAFLEAASSVLVALRNAQELLGTDTGSRFSLMPLGKDFPIEWQARFLPKLRVIGSRLFQETAAHAAVLEESRTYYLSAGRAAQAVPVAREGQNLYVLGKGARALVPKRMQAVPENSDDGLEIVRADNEARRLFEQLIERKDVLGGIVVLLEDWVNAQDRAIFEGQLQILEQTADLITQHGGEVQIAASRSMLLEATEVVPGLEAYTVPISEGLKVVVAGTPRAIAARGLQTSEGAYPLKVYTRGAIRHQAELLIPIQMTSRKDSVNQRLARFIARVRQAQGSETEIQMTLDRLARGNTEDNVVDEAFLTRAAARVSLPFIKKVPLGQIIDWMRKVAQRIQTWA